ncbi:MAG: MFS transporter [Archangium sp.]|nr:MFS transporter [Archangium sp.]
MKTNESRSGEPTRGGSERAGKWLVLVAFMFAAGLNQALWLNFAPLLTLVQTRYSVSETVASLLVLVFPLVYVLLSAPAGGLTDRRGYRWTLVFGSVVQAAFACLRIYDGNFWVLLVAQTGIAVAQPFIVNSISKLVADWFPKDASALATGLGTMGMFLGMAAGMAATPPLVQAYDVRGTMMVFAVLSVLCAAVVVALVRAQGPAVADEEVPMKTLLKNGQLVVLFVVAFLGLGYFNGLTTWLEPMLAPNGFDAVKAGNIGGVLIVGGIVGSIVIPALSDKFQRRKPFLVGSVMVALALTVPVCTSRDETLVMVASAGLGFFFLPALALMLDMCAAIAGEKAAGAATGLLMLFGNAGGVVVVMVMDAAKGDSKTWDNATYVLYAVVVLAIGIAVVAARETMKLIRSPAPAGEG